MLTSLSADPILIAGAPRSGTSWLAKIIDSHPGVLYRHEPDNVRPANNLTPREQIQAWLDVRTVRVSAKKPAFPKRWMSGSQMMARQALARSIGMAAHLPLLGIYAERMPLPDFLPRHPNYGPAKVALKMVNWDPGPTIRMLPDARCLFIVRHPCGVVSSIMKGTKYRAIEHLDHLHRRDLVEKLTRGWVSFNERALESINDQPNAQVVIYESLCSHPLVCATGLFEFVGLEWDKQIMDFIGDSTTTNSRGYFDVFRSSMLAARRWQVELQPDSQEIVLDIVRAHRSLGRYWPDTARAFSA
jgi:Sulfotransferase family